jgi:hypothetical protein
LVQPVSDILEKRLNNVIFINYNRFEIKNRSDLPLSNLPKKLILLKKFKNSQDSDLDPTSFCSDLEPVRMVQ